MDPWLTLGILPSASPAEVRAAYRRAVFAAHPDHGGSAAAFRALEVAFRYCLTIAEQDVQPGAHVDPAPAAPAPRCLARAPATLQDGVQRVLDVAVAGVAFLATAYVVAITSLTVAAGVAYVVALAVLGFLTPG